MGRRAANLLNPSHWVFNRLADDYVYRPSYPEALITHLFDLAGGIGARIADLGAGIGHLALPLALLGARVTAVEPAEEMLRALRARDPEGAVACVHGTAEHTGLDSGAFDLVLIAEAVQWIDPDLAGKEARRILDPAGRVATVETNFGEGAFIQGLIELMSRANPKASHRPKGRARQLLAVAVRSRPTIERFTQEILLNRETLRAFLRSLSTVGPALGPARLSTLLTDAEALSVNLGGALVRRELVLTWSKGRRPSGP